MLAYIYNKVKTQVAKLTAPLSSREGMGVSLGLILFITFLFITSSLLFSSCGAETNIKKGDALYAIGEYFDAAAEYKKGYSRTAVKDKPKRGERLGFRLWNPHNWTFATPSIYLSDLHDENVIRSRGGSVFVVDCDIRLNAPDLRTGGTRLPTNTVQFPDNA